MRYLINCLFLNLIKILNKFGRGFYIKRRILSSENILINNFKENSNFNFIQVGANDGISFDFLYDFVIKRDSKGIVIEPINEYFEELVINYKNFPKIIKLNCAVHPTEKEVSIYKIASNSQYKYPDWVKGIASLDPLHHKKTNIDTIDIVKDNVISENLMMIIKDNYKSTTIDYFQIDTEGFDYEILKMLSFSEFKPAMIKFEHVNLNKEDKENSLILLRKEGYYLFDELGDTIGIDLHKIKMI